MRNPNKLIGPEKARITDDYRIIVYDPGAIKPFDSVVQDSASAQADLRTTLSAYM